MKNPFSYVKGLILKYTQETPELKQTKAKHKSIVTRIMEKIRPGKAIAAEQLQETPGQYATGKAIRRKAMLSAEAEATQKALDVIAHAMQNPEDSTAQLAKNKAIEYLNRNKELQGKGDLQDWNRQQIAERWIKSDLSSVTGQEERKQRQLDQFNKNMGTKLNEDTWKTMEKIMATPAFQKVLEIYIPPSDIMEIVADAVESLVDPVRIEQTLELYTTLGADEFELFSDLVRMEPENYKDFYDEALTKIGESDRMEPYEINEALWSLYVKYK